MTEHARETATVHAVGDIHSDAFSFFSHIKGEVDPRTGMYSARVELMTGEGNRLRGPHFEFRLAYSPLNTRDDGFGEGWHLGLTELDKGMLTLGSGDRYKAGWMEPGQITPFPDRKLETFRMIPGSGMRTAVVEHIDGSVEHLFRAEAGFDALRTERIVQASGNGIRLGWKLAYGAPVLSEVVDDEGTVLLNVSYEGNLVVMRIETGLAEPLEIHFLREGDLLRQIVVPAIDSLNLAPLASGIEQVTWQFEYETSAPVGELPLRLLKRMVSPGGTTDVVHYNERALELPPMGPRKFMPAVSRLETYRTIDRELLRAVEYDYGRNNFYGFPAVGNWENGQDKLLHLPPSEHGFVYTTTETLLDAARHVYSVTTRTYNNYHLAVNETTVRGDVTQDTHTTYGADPTKPFETQAKNFQLPRKVTTSLYHANDPGTRQVTETTHTYDVDGNMLTRHDSATDVTEVSTYYPVEGAIDDDRLLCPPDPLGMVRRLASRQIIPGRRGGDDLVTRYEYAKLRVRAGSEALLRGRTSYVQACGETAEASLRPPMTIRRRAKFFIDDQQDQHGALRMETYTVDDLVEKRIYAYTILPSAAGRIDGAAMLRTDTTISRGAISHRMSETKYLVSGLVTSTTDMIGNRTDRAYDALGRVVREERLPDDPAYRTVLSYAYQVSTGERSVVRVGITGLPHRTWLDERGLVVREDEPLPPPEREVPFRRALKAARRRGSRAAIRRLLDERMMTVREVSYDLFGQPVSETLHDRLGDQGDRHITTRSTYDDWGQPRRVTRADGSVAVTERRLVAVDGEVWQEALQWVETADGARIAGWQRSVTDMAGLVRRTDVGRWGGNGSPEATYAWRYDGLGRCVSITDPLGQVTRQTWDVLSRLHTTTLPNGDVVTRTYARGHEADLLATIAITPAGTDGAIVLGERTFDALGRIVTETAGSLTHRFGYVAAQLAPARHAMPGGGVIASTYDRKLGEVLTRETLGTTVLRQASYDTQRGLPKVVTAESGTMRIRADFLGRMVEQDQTIGGQPERHAKVTVSRAGLELVREGVDGARQSIAYDDLGRISRVVDDVVSTTFEYDGLSRVTRRTTTRRDGTDAVIQAFTYDPLGRVDGVTWTQDARAGRHRLVLTYRSDNKVEWKRWFADAATRPFRTESMAYDARGRLIRHGIDCDADGAYPRDEAGHGYRLQTFAHDALDNLVEVRTTLLDARMNVTRYTYDDVDRDRAIRLTNTLPGYPGAGAPIELRYDANGNLLDDGMGHELHWDAAGRLASVTTVRPGDPADGRSIVYGYGPDGRIATVRRDGATTARYHSDGAIYAEFGSTEQRRFIRARGALVAETALVHAIRKTWLLGTDPQGSVIVESGSSPEG